LEAAHDQLEAHPDRDRLHDEENRRYFSDRDEIEAALGRLPEAVTQRLRHVLGLWEVLIFFLEESRACSFAIRRRLVQQLSQFTLSGTAAAALTTSPDGEAVECAICNEELSQPDQPIVQLPCHASHLFNWDCILVRLFLQIHSCYLNMLLISIYFRCSAGLDATGPALFAELSSHFHRTPPPELVDLVCFPSTYLYIVVVNFVVAYFPALLATMP
jgi:hypothetical protein